MLGGSSNLNYLFYVRGDAKDYDHWSDLGFPDWSYKKVLPYFLRSEKYVKKSEHDVRLSVNNSEMKNSSNGINHQLNWTEPR